MVVQIFGVEADVGHARVWNDGYQGTGLGSER